MHQTHSREKETDFVKEQWTKNARLRQRVKYSKEHRLEIYRLCERKSYSEKADFVKEQWNKNARLREKIKYSKEHRLEIYRPSERKSYNEKTDFVKDHTIIKKIESVKEHSKKKRLCEKASFYK